MCVYVYSICNVPATGKSVRASTEKIRQTAINKCAASKPRGWPSASEDREIRGAIESIVHEGIYYKLISGLHSFKERENKHLQEHIVEMGMKVVSMKDVGVRDEIVCDAAEAVDKLRHLNDCSTPLQKLCCLTDVTQLLSVSVEKQRRKGKSDSLTVGGNNEDTRDFVLSADDVLPMTVAPSFTRPSRKL